MLYADITEKPRTAEENPLKKPIWQRRYEVVRELGGGGMGRVLLAKRRSDSVMVCLKFLNPDTDSRTAEQEGRALMRLRHSSIVSLLDFSLEDKPPWLATEYVASSTLQTYLKDHGPLPATTVLAILKQILGALDCAHGEGVIHRDLKPANLMIGAGDGDIGVRIRILDFGIAIIDEFDHAGRLTAQGADPLGTLLYMAPEQLRGETLTPACDLYAVGLMTWEMFMGRSPFEGMIRSQMMFEKVTRSEGFALEASAALPAALQMFVEACTLPEPRSRPSARKGLAMLTNSLFIRGQVRE